MFKIWYLLVNWINLKIRYRSTTNLNYKLLLVYTVDGGEGADVAPILYGVWTSPPTHTWKESEDFPHLHMKSKNGPGGERGAGMLDAKKKNGGGGGTWPQNS